MAVSDEIKERLDIVEVVGSYVPGLRKAGHNYHALCPFHTERTPSFVVFPERQSWRCFGACATGGDVLSFVMGAEKMNFADTVKLLAQRAGVSLPQRQERKERNVLYQINEAAGAYFQELLWSLPGMAVRAYFQQRGVDTETAKRFQLGLSPGSRSELLEHLTTLGYSQEQVVRAGLATSSNDGPPRDLFHGRLMFPIHDDQGNMAGFGGRSLDGSDPKYLNSSRTEVFDKGHILYAFHLAKASIKEHGEVVVVEGYMDALAAHQHGFENVVACMGTALTERQVSLLRGAGRSFVLALDPDAAGRHATFRDLVESWHALERQLVGRRGNVSMYQPTADLSAIRVALMPQGKDPDEVIRQDPELWRSLVSQALPLVDYFLASAPERWDLSTSEGKAAAAQELWPVIMAIQNTFEQEKYLRRLADALGVQPATLEASLGRPRSVASPRRGRASTTSASTTPFEGEHRDTLEEHLLALLLQWPELRQQAQTVEPGALERWENRQLFTLWIECSRIDKFQETLEGDIRQQANYLIELPLPPMDLRHREQAVKDCVHRLEERRLRRLKAEEALLLEEVSEPSEPGEWKEPTVLEQQIVETNEKLRLLFDEKGGYQRSRRGH